MAAAKVSVIMYGGEGRIGGGVGELWKELSEIV